jgi:hypothetical protein
MAHKILTDNLSEPLNGATTAKFDINSGVGHLTIDKITDEQVLASGTLQYLEQQGLPVQTLDLNNGQATLMLRAENTGRTGFHFPWATCWGGAYEWQVHLNPKVSSGIIAHSDGGNIKLNLVGMAVTCVSAETGGGNMEVALPDNIANLSVAARSGGGNVTVNLGSGIIDSNTVNANTGAGNVFVLIPGDVAARIHATSGAGKVTVDPRFSKTDKNTYQSPDFDSTANKVDIELRSGAGNVSVTTK